MFDNLFKSKQQREQERETAIRTSISKQRQMSNRLRKDERRFMEMAIRAKKRKKIQRNFKIASNLVAQTIMKRRAIDSQLLHFEIVLQIRDQAKLFGEFGQGMKAMAKSVNEVFKEFNDGQMIQDLDSILQKNLSMEEMMNNVLDRITDTSDALTSDAASEGISSTEVEKMIENMAVSDTAPDASDANLIDAQLKAIENELALKKKSEKHLYSSTLKIFAWAAARQSFLDRVTDGEAKIQNCIGKKTQYKKYLILEKILKYFKNFCIFSKKGVAFFQKWITIIRNKLI